MAGSPMTAMGDTVPALCWQAANGVTANVAGAAAARPKKSAWKDTCCRKQSVCGNQCMAPGELCCDNRICGGKTSSGSMTATSSSSSGPITTSKTSTTSASSGTRTATGSDTTGDSTLATGDILSIIQTAVPAVAQTDPASACFLSADRDSVYTTPGWYSGLPSQAQSYFSSVHAASASGGLLRLKGWVVRGMLWGSSWGGGCERGWP
uniref:Uncharacterized protein n=1 Tax=Bionectria ochroleuca TaxID=29856 RepID=A0A0B7JQC1_BIOOC